MVITPELFLQYIVRIGVLLFCLPVHEYAHAKAAYIYGDSAAVVRGRLSLNPVHHLDPIGSISMVALGIGWAKPVPVNSINFKNPKLDFAIVSLAGPLSNIILGLLCMIFYKLSSIIFFFNTSWVFLETIELIFYYGTSINIMLAVFNLLPIPPLDGSRLITAVLPHKIYTAALRYEWIGMLAVMVLLFFGVLDAPLNFLTNALFKFLDFITSFIDIFFNLI